ncbi:MAG TPA: aminotransferase class I/II-fold pyridoxal phosphate-dependent enzyme, partial [Myxococcota bacterium]|nr:aminotransferase class I/II-fold pyridoxal phosphate-dependent enzyme [Myxococcota bacterium]
LGWLLAPEPVARAAAAVHQFVVACAPTPSQYLALEAFEEPRWLGALRPELARGRAAMLAAIESELGLPHAPAEGAFYVFVDTRAVAPDSLRLAEELLTEADVVTAPGIAFGAPGEGHLRLSYGGSPAEIARGVARIGRHLRQEV